MSKISVPVLYQTETFSSGFRQKSSRDDRPARAIPPSGAAPGHRPASAPEFLVQMIATGNPDLRKVLGRCDVATARERAYAFAAAHKPSRLAEETTPSEFRA
ncbi:MAG: hypothetical protein IOC64_12215 [Methylobacterium sp.]|nr:hypothetical protein [Methylobacterium sp.]MCA3606981.1 hypothetical protein [Methylobacterium sp.]MCA3610036.1 hypothetical protein [Methylobacterium sp.]MCA3620225.1 hypothetical protein [Methylobacterium sp.]